MRLPCSCCGMLGSLALIGAARSILSARTPRVVLMHAASGGILIPLVSHQSPELEVDRRAFRLGHLMRGPGRRRCW